MGCNRDPRRHRYTGRTRTGPPAPSPRPGLAALQPGLGEYIPPWRTATDSPAASPASAPCRSVGRTAVPAPRYFPTLRRGPRCRPGEQQAPRTLRMTRTLTGRTVGALQSGASPAFPVSVGSTVSPAPPPVRCRKQTSACRMVVLGSGRPTAPVIIVPGSPCLRQASV